MPQLQELGVVPATDGQVRPAGGPRGIHHDFQNLGFFMRALEISELLGKRKRSGSIGRGEGGAWEQLGDGKKSLLGY